MAKHGNQGPEVDRQRVGDCQTDAQKHALWRARSWRFKARRTVNVLRAAFTGQVPLPRAWLALRHPAQMVALAIRPARSGGLLLVCPAAAATESGDGDPNGSTEREQGKAR